eukprot:757760-Hanusia_phi.AAC.7
MENLVVFRGQRHMKVRKPNEVSFGFENHHSLQEEQVIVKYFILDTHESHHRVIRKTHAPRPLDIHFQEQIFSSKKQQCSKYKSRGKAGMKKNVS